MSQPLFQASENRPLKDWGAGVRRTGPPRRFPNSRREQPIFHQSAELAMLWLAGRLDSSRSGTQPDIFSCVVTRRPQCRHFRTLKIRFPFCLVYQTGKCEQLQLGHLNPNSSSGLLALSSLASCLFTFRPPLGLDLCIGQTLCRLVALWYLLLALELLTRAEDRSTDRTTD